MAHTQEKIYPVLGVMSGTSLDGVDIAYVVFKEKNRQWSYQIRQAKTIAYTPKWQEKLKQSALLPLEQVKALDVAYTDLLADYIQTFIKEFAITNIAAVCSHGHTVFHAPEKHFTYQIGNLPILAQKIKQKVVCDFRVQDVALKGQGAPLVPIGDMLLFSEYTHCLNFGGFANISFTKNKERIAFDICPVNIVLNHYAQKLGFSYDDKGRIARATPICKALLLELNALAFYNQKPPKSLGVEWVRKEVFSIIDTYDLSPEQVIATVTEHIALQIARVLPEKATVLCTGGGVYNSFLLEQIASYSPAKLHIPKDNTIAYKEALIFGFLGVLRLQNNINCLKSVTGAVKNHSSGKIYSPL